MISKSAINEISAATKAICPKEHSHGHQIVVWVDGSWSEAVDGSDQTGRLHADGIEPPLIRFKAPTGHADAAAMIRTAEAERERLEAYERGEDLRARQAAGGKIGAQRTAELLGPEGRAARARAGGLAKAGKRGELICQCNEAHMRTTHNHDASYRRSWKLWASGLVERTNSASKYQPWITGETIPATIRAAAKEHNITIQPGRALGGGEQ